MNETREPQTMRDQVIRAVAEAFRKLDDPGISDLDDEQPMSIHLPLGVLRAARNVQRHTREAYMRSRFDDQYEVPEASPPDEEKHD